VGGSREFSIVVGQCLHDVPIHQCLAESALTAIPICIREPRGICRVGGGCRLRIPSEVRHATLAWDIGRTLTYRRAKRGVVNNNFIIQTPHGKYVLRQVSHVHHKTSRDLQFELAYLDYLKRARFPYGVPSPIATKKGSLFITVQGHYYWLYKFLEGMVVAKLREPHLAQLAQMMATYHRLVEGSNLHNGKPASDPYSRTSTLKEIEEYRMEILGKKNTNRQDRTFLEESARLMQILRRFDGHPQSDLGLYPIHRDMISENLIWNQGKLAGVIDFEHVSESNDPIVKDIAVTMQYCCRDKKVRHRLDIDSAGKFLQSYMASHPLSEEEVVLIPDLITTGFVEDFVFAFWMLRNDPERAKRSEEDGYGLTLYSRAAQWSHRNRKRIAEAILKDRGL
jgi:homoserine kinase type II